MSATTFINTGQTEKARAGERAGEQAPERAGQSADQRVAQNLDESRARGALGSHTARDAPGDSAWDYISPTRLNLWLRCPLAFRLRYIDGVRPRTTPSLFLGKQVHAALEFFYRRRQQETTVELPDIRAHLDAGWEQAVAAEKIALASRDEEARLRRQCLALVEAYLATLPADERPPLYVEQGASVPLVDPRSGDALGIDLVGVVDLVLPGESGPLIADFKTAARNTAPLPIQHEIQLGCYALLIRQLTGRRESALEIRSLVKTKVPQVAFHRYPARTDAQLGRLFAALRAYLADLGEANFVYRPGLACALCDYCQTHCAAWSG